MLHAQRLTGNILGELGRTAMRVEGLDLVDFWAGTGVPEIRWFV